MEKHQLKTSITNLMKLYQETGDVVVIEQMGMLFESYQKQDTVRLCIEQMDELMDKIERYGKRRLSGKTGI